MKFEIRDRDLGFQKEDVENWEKREAARCILLRDNKVALINVQKYSYHILPGGGIEDGENERKALKREIKEETGSEIKIQEKIGKVKEFRSHPGSIEASKFFYAKETRPGKPDHTQKELENRYKLEWYKLGEAVQKLQKQKPSHYIARFITERDKKVLKYFKEKTRK